jgi:hypothetical protein
MVGVPEAASAVWSHDAAATSSRRRSTAAARRGGLVAISYTRAAAAG